MGPLAAVTGWRAWLLRRRWIAGALALSDGLLLPGRPRSRAADLLLTPGGVTIFAAGRSADLAWDDHRRAAHTDQPSGWHVGGYFWGASQTGIALVTWGDAATVIAGVRRITHASGTGLPGTVPTVAVPLQPLVAYGIVAQYVTIEALCTVLAERPAVRGRLADLARTRPLAAALAASRLGPRGDPDVVLRSGVEVLTALKAVGYVHRLHGRPVPGDPLPDRVQAYARVRDHLDRSPYARRTEIRPETVARLVGSEYLDVAPWPFHALLR